MATTQYATTQQSHGKSLKERIRPLLNFWQKLSNDWIFNLAGLLAYNILTSIIPILLALLAIAGFILNAISPGSQQLLANTIADALPGGASGSGGEFVRAALTNLQRQAGVLLVIALLTAIFTGSRLFVTIENCFGIIFRLRSRSFIRQNMMAIGMLLLYVVLVPIIFLASFVPTTIVNILNAYTGRSGFSGLLIHAVGILASFVVALILFGSIYVVVPNRSVRVREVWRGTLLASVLLLLYEMLFPIYESLVLKPGNYGAVAGFAIVIMIFFYYLAVIVLLGAEVNSWAAGQRETASDIAAILHEVQAHNTTRGAAGPTAGEPQEDLQDHEGAPVMATRRRAKEHELHDHHGDVQPKTLQPGSSDSGHEGQANNQPAGPVSGTEGHATGSQMAAGASRTEPDSGEARESENIHTAPYAHDVGTPQAHRIAGALPTRHVQRPTRSGRRSRRKTPGALGVMAGAGLAAAVLWLRRRQWLGG